MSRPIATISRRYRSRAAGLLAAVTAARTGANVILIDDLDGDERFSLVGVGGEHPSCTAQPRLHVTDSSPNTYARFYDPGCP